MSAPFKAGDPVITGLGRPGVIVDTYAWYGQECAHVHSDGTVTPWHVWALRHAEETSA